MPTLRTQQERSDYYHKYLASVLGLPFGIGVHVSPASPSASPSASSSDASERSSLRQWFKWYDEPSNGRPKYGSCGENSNCERALGCV